MHFGKRISADAISADTDGSAPVVQETCVRCYGTGWVRERGDRLRCKACAGSGRVQSIQAEAVAI
jgi:DnaJ-class molecular chaperone